MQFYWEGTIYKDTSDIALDDISIELGACYVEPTTPVLVYSSKIPIKALINLFKTLLYLCCHHVVTLFLHQVDFVILKLACAVSNNQVRMLLIGFV